MNEPPRKPRRLLPASALRAGLGGVLMGLANLVPGISGGTMLLATGVYPRFIRAVAEITTLKFRLRSLLFLLVIATGALCAILSLAGPVRDLVESRRWIMYALFIGLTLGGVPLVWRRARPLSPAVAWGIVAGFALMVAVTLFHPAQGVARGPVFLVLAGTAGAAAMILPGISGAYLLLILGQYEVILGALDKLKRAVTQHQHALLHEVWPVVLPVAMGVALGVFAVSNLLRWALDRHEKFTLGVLLGLLFGSILGIWPFQHAVRPPVSSPFFDRPDHWPLHAFAPTPGQVAAALGLVAAGILATLAVDALGRALETSEAGA